MSEQFFYSKWMVILDKIFSSILIFITNHSNLPMKKESFPSKRNYKASANASKTTPRNNEARSQFHLPGIVRTTFINWLKELPSEERYLALRVPAPEITQEFIQISKNTQILDRVENPESKKLASQKAKSYTNAIQSFIESLTLISDSQFLDCLGFDFGFVGCPERVFETFSTILSFKLPLVPDQEDVKNKHLCEWIFKAVSFITEKLQKKMKEDWDSKDEIKKEKYEKKQFGIFWNNISEEQKLSFLYCGCGKMSELHDKIIIESGDKIDSYDLKHEIEELLTSESKYFCNKLFKWRAKKGNAQMCAYYSILFNLWRQKYQDINKKQNSVLRETKDRKKKEKNILFIKEKIEKGQIQKQERPEKQIFQKIEEIQKNQKVQVKKPLKKRNKKKKEKSQDASSNQTNETELHEVKEEIDILEIIREKTEDDFEDCTNKISEQANKGHFSRVKAYQRVMSVFKNFGVETKLFGSCACGLAINCSDVDMAIGQNILNYFSHEETNQDRMKAAFQYFSSLFQSYSWVSNLKCISTASIPIIKFTVDTSIKVTEPTFCEQLQDFLNEQISQQELVHVDLTIETKQEEKSQHLGVISTQTIKNWISVHPSLTKITILLKYELAKRSLNQTYTGGLNTYSLVVLIVAFLQYRQISKSQLDSVVFEKLLKFYAEEFDQKNYGVDLLRKQIIFVKDLNAGKNVMQRADLQVRDPLCSGKNMTRNCYRFSQIKNLFREINKSCFMMAKSILTTQMIADKKNCQKLKAEKYSYRDSSELDKNFFTDFIFSNL